MINKKKTVKKKGFYFKDYTESELIDNNNSNVIKVSASRVTFLFLIFFSLILIFSIKITYLSLSQEKTFSGGMSEVKILGLLVSSFSHPFRINVEIINNFMILFIT